MIRPVGEYIIVEHIPYNKTPGGIVIPDNAEDARRFHKGHVISVGKGLPTIDGSRRVPPEVAPGEIVLYKFGEDIKDSDGKDYKLVAEKNIVAVLSEVQASAANQ